MENKTQLQKIEPLEFTPSQDFEYAQALQRKNGSWWSRAWHGDEWFSGVIFIMSCVCSVFGLGVLLSGSGWLLGLASGAALLSLGGLNLNARRVKKSDEESLANRDWKFFYQLALGVESFNRKAIAWNGLLAALKFGAKDRMSHEEKENTFRVLIEEREGLLARIELAEALSLPASECESQVAGYLEALRDTEEEMAGAITVPETSLNKSGIQEILENEVAFFECCQEVKALPEKKS